jgi:PKD repeat protein
MSRRPRVQSFRLLRRTAGLGLAAAFCLATPADVSAQAYPVRKSATNRYLVDQLNRPFLITGDSPQALMVNLSTSEAEMYFANRAAHGFNTLWINLLCSTYTAGREDAGTYDGILPFTGYLPGHTGDPLYYDLATPNPAYFARCDQMLAMAASHGLLVLLDPIETGSFLPAFGGGDAVMPHNGAAACRDYGRYLGNRYRGVPNIIWMSGNDYQVWDDGISDSFVTAVALGIQETDPDHIHTVELNYLCSGSLDDHNWESIIQLNASYTYFPTYAQVLNDYNRTNFQPVFIVEANYEFEHLQGTVDTTPLNLRKQEYWSILSGATGQLYGNHYTWTFTSGWESHLDTPGAIQIAYLKALFEPRAWYNLIPDQNHTLVTAGNGTFSSSGYVEDNSYLTAARTPDGELAMAYMPTIRDITVNLAELSAPVTARWYDPTSGTFASIVGSPFPNSGSHVFSPPGNNGDGDGDWVLVLETLTGDTDCDGVVSMTDVPAFVLALVDPTAYPGCDPTHADINHDGHIDGRDIQGFCILVTGSLANLPPIPVAGADPTEGVAPLTVIFSSAGSSDPEGRPLTYLWLFGDSTTSTEANPVHIYSLDGQYLARLTVSDGVNFATSTPLTISALVDPGTIRIGETTVFGGNDSGNGNLLLVQDATLSQAATIRSLSFYVNAASGDLRLGIYDATGPGGGPGALKAQTNTFTPVVGWNTAAVITPVSLQPANYWLAYLPSSSALNFATNFSIGSYKYATFAFGPMPASFPPIAGQGTTHWSLYGTLTIP